MSDLAPKSFLIVDEDDVIHNMVSFQLKSMGVQDIDLFTDASAGWAAVLNKTYDFIFIDWKLAKLPGITIFNRLRGMGNYQNTPILIASNVIYKKDFKIFDEFPGTCLIDKPFSNRQFEKKVRELFAETLWYEQNLKVIVSLIDQVNNDPKTAVKVLLKLVEKAPNPLPLLIMGGKELINRGFLDEAEDWFRNIIAKDEENPVAWGELGRIFTIRELLDEASKYLSNAHKLSPKNIARLTLLAEVEMKRNDPVLAKKYFEEALEIDTEDEKAKSGLKLSSSLESYFKSSPDVAKKQSSFASLTNLMGISLVNSGKIHDGIEQYHAALNFVKSDEDKVRLMFNMALAYLKMNQSEEAKIWLKKATKLNVKEFTKPQDLLRKLSTQT